MGYPGSHLEDYYPTELIEEAIRQIKYCIYSENIEFRVNKLETQIVALNKLLPKLDKSWEK